ncbi:MAG: GNAT family N-acetyltransferase, partial [Candidatus Limnocylindria bacterium]
YNADRESYSPGLILLYELFDAAADAGVSRVDFGKGHERYKSSWMTGEEPLAAGAVDLRPLGRLVSGAVSAGRVRLRGTRVATPAREARRRMASIGRKLRGR